MNNAGKDAGGGAAPAKPHFLAGVNMGVKTLNNIRANMNRRHGGFPRRVATLEPMAPPLGLEHLVHFPTPELVNGGKDYHKNCGLRETELRITRRPWKPHYHWVTPVRQRVYDRETERIKLPPIDATTLPPSMRNCYNRFVQKWRREGLEIEEISNETCDLEASYVIDEEETNFGYRQSYQRYTNCLGWLTKEQLKKENAATHAHKDDHDSSDFHAVEVHSRAPGAKRGVNVTNEKIKEEKGKEDKDHHHHHHHHHEDKEPREHQPQYQPADKGVLMNEKTKQTYKQQHKGTHIKYDENNIEKTLHPPDKDYGFDKIEEPATPYRRSTGETTQRIDAEVFNKQIMEKKSKDSTGSSARPSGIRDAAREHYRGMGLVMMNSKAMQEQIAKDEEEERKKKMEEKK